MGGGGPASAGTACVFPFTYDNVTYAKCTYKKYEEAWCATRTDGKGRYNGSWGVCNKSCTKETRLFDKCQSECTYTKGYCTVISNECQRCFSGEEKMAFQDSCEGESLPLLGEFIITHPIPLAYSLVVFVLGAALCLFTVYWRELQAQRRHRSQAMGQAEDISTAMAQLLLPSRAISNYRFRGMQRKERTVSIEFKELGLVLPDSRTVLHGVTGAFNAGHMAAILGPSGAGKTTFMNVLCGKATYGKMTGEVKFNGEKCNISEIRPALAFVPQDDIVHANLTVRENIHFSAKLRNPASTPPQRIDDIVEDVLRVMQIEHIQLCMVGNVEERGISGGQRKRVNIGLELAACSALLFLDEPTSGLDATSSLQIMNSLKKMTELHMNIIMVIHQPRYSLFTLFDDVLLLGPGGRTVYQGPSQSAMDYFEDLGFELPPKENPADWFMDILSGGVPSTEIHNFKPAMLFDAWLQRGDSVRGQTPPKWRGLSNLEDEQVFMQAVEMEWDNIDCDRSGSLDVHELKRLVQRCGCTDPDAAAVQNLFSRIAGAEEFVFKQDLVDFLRGLTSTVAVDRAVSETTGSRAASKTTGSMASRPLGGATEVELQAAAPLLATSGVEDLAAPGLGPCGQFRVILTRRLVTMSREMRQRSIDTGLILSCATLAGVMHKGEMGTHGEHLPANLHIFHLGLALLSTISALRVFGEDQAIFWRESSSGMNILSFFLAKVCGNFFDLLLQCTTYVFVYFFLTRPPTTYWYYFTPCFLVCLVASGWGVFISTVVPPKNATLAGVIYALIFCGVFGTPFKIHDYLDNRFTELVLLISITRWSVPMTFMPTVDLAKQKSSCIDPSLRRLMSAYESGHILRHSEHHQYNRYISNMTNGGVNAYSAGFLVLGVTTVLLHALGYMGLRFTNRAKQV